MRDMFYQILIETKENNGKSNENKEIIVLDLVSRDKVLKDIVVPYLNNTEFVVDGYTLDKKKIYRLKIMTTENSGLLEKTLTNQ